MITFASFTLPEFTWVDEFNFLGVYQQQERSLSGAVHIENTVITTARPITLKSEIESAELFMQLQAHSIANLTPFNITINDRVYEVIWRHEPMAVVGIPLINYADAQPDYFTEITLTLQTV